MRHNDWLHRPGCVITDIPNECKRSSRLGTGGLSVVLEIWMASLGVFKGCDFRSYVCRILYAPSMCPSYAAQRLAVSPRLCYNRHSVSDRQDLELVGDQSFLKYGLISNKSPLSRQQRNMISRKRSAFYYCLTIPRQSSIIERMQTPSGWYVSRKPRL